MPLSFLAEEIGKGKDVIKECTNGLPDNLLAYYSWSIKEKPVTRASKKEGMAPATSLSDEAKKDLRGRLVNEMRAISKEIARWQVAVRCVLKAKRYVRRINPPMSDLEIFRDALSSQFISGVTAEDQLRSEGRRTNQWGDKFMDSLGERIQGLTREDAKELMKQWYKEAQMHSACDNLSTKVKVRQ